MTVRIGEPVFEPEILRLGGVGVVYRLKLRSALQTIVDKTEGNDVDLERVAELFFSDSQIGNPLPDDSIMEESIAKRPRSLQQRKLHHVIAELRASGINVVNNTINKRDAAVVRFLS